MFPVLDTNLWPQPLWQANELVHQNDIELQMMTAWLGFAKIGIICIIQGERWCQPKDRLICHTVQPRA